MRSNAPKWRHLTGQPACVHDDEHQCRNAEVAATGVQAYGQTQAAAHKAAGEIKRSSRSSSKWIFMSAVGAIGGAQMMSDREQEQH